MTTAAILAASGSPGTTTGFKNRIINGAMTIFQRGASVTSSGYSVDRWSYTASQSSKGTANQSSTAPAGFVNSLSFTSSSAYSVGSGDYFLFYQGIEGLNIADLGWGTANAKTVTLSFWVQSSLTGIFGGALNNGQGSSYAYPFTYTISSANTWTQISITIAGPTSGTWVTNNGTGVQVAFGLGCGSSFSGTAGSWSANNYFSATGATSVVGTSGATFYITGVQLEVGTTATNFDFRSIGTELSLCQRYYQTCGLTSNAMSFSGNTRSVNNAFFNVPLCCAMRATPSYSITNGGTTRVTFAGTEVNSSANSTTLGGVSPIVVYDASGNFNLNLNYQGAISGITLTGSTAGMAIMWSPAGNFNFSAEL